MSGKKSTLSQRLFDQMYEDILHLRLGLGQKLTLQSLAQRYQASITPIREALSRLAEYGLVTYYSNCGVSVIDFTDEDIQDLFRFIGDLDALAVLYCETSSRKPMLFFELEETLSTGSRLLGVENREEWETYSRKFHKLFYDFAQSPCLAEACNRFYPKLELLTGLYSQEGKAAQAIQQEHEGIFQAIKDSGFSAGAQAMRCHLQQDMFLALGAFRMRKDKSD